ncbi:MAG: hypothetical protein GPOALKHO_001296 [Sodalis sp.]|nr:MAG: hypothetical protein GPOALKHO_001296 [Sodalis sp.]
MAATSNVSLVNEINELASEDMETNTDCGKMTLYIAWVECVSMACAALHCALSTETMASRIVFEL